MAKVAKSKTKRVSNKDQVIASMKEMGGTITVDELAPVLPLNKKQIYRILHEQLVPAGIAARNEETGTYWLTDPEGIVERGEKMEETKDKIIHDESPASTEEEGTLDQSRLFSEHLRNIGVRRDVINTITEMFFSGDINDLQWLKRVLTLQAAGFVSPHQANITLSWWSNTRNLDIDDSLFIKLGKEAVKTEEKTAPAPAPVAEAPAAQGLDLGVGWDIQKDESGEWVAVQGGPLSQKEAYDRAERRQAMSVVKQQKPSVAVAGAGEAKGEAPNFMDKVVDKLLEVVFTGGGIGGDKDGALMAQITQLQGQVQNMREQQQEERMQRMEALIGQALSRDPLEDYNKVERIRQQLGAGAPIITDQSPAVQLIKDATDKFDKTSGRLFGIMERVMIKSDQFNPENTRTPEERDAVASKLLGEVGDREEVRDLRQTTFGI